MAKKKVTQKVQSEDLNPQIVQIEESVNSNPQIVQIEESNPEITAAPAQIVESVSDDRNLAEIVRLRDLWRREGLSVVKNVFPLILREFEDCTARSDVWEPILYDGMPWDLNDILSAIQNEEEDLVLPFAQAVKRQKRKVGISVYVLVALHNLGEEI